jgi:hypothetical protein
MRAISVWAPWALLWLLEDEKIFETRSWYTGYRGPLLIHATKKQDGEVKDFIGSREFRQAMRRHGLTESDIHFGAIIGKVDLIGCSLMSRMPEPSRRERMFGFWSPYRYALERGPRPVIFDRPIPYRGSQARFLNVPDSLLTAQYI